MGARETITELSATSSDHTCFHAEQWLHIKPTCVSLEKTGLTPCVGVSVCRCVGVSVCKCVCVRESVRVCVWVMGLFSSLLTTFM